jgi:glycosyltransferase 2 family protein
VRLNVTWLLPALAVMLVYQIATGFGWWLQLELLGQPRSRVAIQMAWAQSNLVRYVPGNVLFVVSRVVLTEREGVPRRVTLSAMFYETGLWFASAATFAAWFLVTHPDKSNNWLSWAAVAAVPLSLACLHPRLFEPLANRMLRAFGRREVAALLSARQLLVLFAYYTLTWAVMGLAMLCVARSIYPAGISDWGLIAAAQALAYCASVVTLIFPGGLGIRDGAFAWAMTTGVPGRTFAIAAAVALAGRLVLIAADAIYAAAITAAARRMRRKAEYPQQIPEAASVVMANPEREAGRR